MQKLRCVVILTFFFAIPMVAQTVRGRVTLQGEGTALPGVTVSIDELGLTTVTDADGRYSLTLPASRRGEAKITASLQGFTTRSATIDTSGNVTHDFVLRASFGQEITVGSRAINAEQEKAVPIDVIPREQIEISPSSETNQIIEKVAPSFNFPRPSVADGTDSVRPATLRGLGPDQVLVMVNGKRRHASALVNVNNTVGRSSQGVDLNTIPASAIDSVEILRDGAAAQYGSDAIAGVLNLVLKSDAAPLKVDVKGGSTTHSDGQMIDANISGGWKIARGAMFGTIEYRDRYPTNRALKDPRSQIVNGDAGNNAVPQATLNLTAEGTADWAHWGLVSSNSFDHKSGVTQKISDFTVLGTQAVQQYADNFTAYTWTDGTPTPSATNSTTGVFITGTTNGFEIQAPADTTPRRLKVYVGLYGAQGNFQAFLGDFSAPAYTDTSLNNVFGNSYAVYTLDYAAASAGQSLIVQYRSLTLYDQDFGNVTLQAATLVGNNSGNVPPTVSISSPTNNAHFTAPTNISITASAADSDGSVSKVEFFQGAIKLGESTNSPYSLVWSNVGAGSYTLTAKATDNLGAATVSAPVSITLSSNTPPGITQQPVSLVVTQGNTATFSVTAIGTAPLSYQWRFGIPGSGGANLAGATNAILSVTNAQPTNAGNYRVIITNLFGSATSAVATLTVLVPPSITQQPQGQTLPEGTNVAFTVMATGTLPLTYQWFFNGAVLSGQTNTMLAIPNVQAANAGSYTVVVGNQAGTVTSIPANLRVLASSIITNIRETGTTASITFTTVSGLTYTVQYENHLDDSVWTPILPSVSGTGSPMTVNDTVATAGTRFYRVRVE